MSKSIVIGAGIMGLTAAYSLLKEGFDVDVYESEEHVGGMAAHFDFDGLSIEKFYHFICKPDNSLLSLLEELDLSNKIRWAPTNMGYFYNGSLYKWGNPIALIAFPRLDIVSKIRYGIHAMYAIKYADFDKLDNQNALEWIKKWIGNKAYNVLWKKLFELKFFEYTQNLSASWIASRIRRVGLSRKNILQEELGYIEGGTNTLISVLTEKIKSMGGKMHTLSPIETIVVKNYKVSGVKLNDEFVESNMVISTVPLPIVSNLLKEFPELSNKYRKVKNIPVICAIIKLTQKITDNFWLNINDREFDVPGIIEYTNLNPLKGNLHIAYIPFYMPEHHPDYEKDDNYFIHKTILYIKRINKNIKDDSIKNIRIFRYRYAQPICEPGYLKKLPPVNPISGLYIADTSYYYPEDRSISESIRFGKYLAKEAIRENNV